MPVHRIDDPHAPQVLPFVQLPRRRDENVIIVEGELAVGRALRSEHRVDAILTTAGHRVRLGDAIDPALPVFEAEASVVRKIVGFDFHRGCLAVMPRPVAPSIETICQRRSGTAIRMVIAEGLADPANLGAVIRSCRAFGASAVVHGRGADPWSRRAIRASMGLAFELPVLSHCNLVAAVKRLRQGLGARTRVVAAVVEPGASSVADYPAPDCVVLMVGNEGAGLSVALRAEADDAVTIPLESGVDSLNVAAATAVLLWSLRSVCH